MVVKVGVAKLGNIASGVMAELLLDREQTVKTCRHSWRPGYKTRAGRC